MGKGIKITIACSLVNFILGSYYAWSVFAEELIECFGWTKAQTSMPFGVYILSFSLMMVVAGRYQDILWPRFVVTIGGLVSGIGLILCLVFPTPIGITLSFGAFYGAGASFAYVAIIPAALKWFPAEKKGLITGIVVMCQGIGALIWPIVFKDLIDKMGVTNTFAIWGVFSLICTCLLAQIIKIPPDIKLKKGEGRVMEPLSLSKFVNLTFILIWLMMGLSIGSSQMITAHLVVITKMNYRIDQGYMFIPLFAFFNTISRLTGGVAADRIGSLKSIVIHYLVLIISLFIYLCSASWQGVLVATAIFGLGTGGLFTVFPTIIVEVYGISNFGIYYGLLFTSVGLGGILGSYCSGCLADKFDTYNPTFIIGIISCGVALITAYLLYKTKYRTLPRTM